MKTRFIGFNVAVLILLCTACGTPDPATPVVDPDQPHEAEITGGPCTYLDLDFSATVTAITPFSTNEHSNNGATRNDITDIFHVQLSFNDGSLSFEPQYLEELLGTVIDSSFLVKHEIKFGTEFTGQLKEIETGSCNPLMVNFDHEF